VGFIFFFFFFFDLYKQNQKRKLDLLSMLPWLGIAGYDQQGFLARSLEFSKAKDFT